MPHGRRMGPALVDAASYSAGTPAGRDGSTSRVHILAHIVLVASLRKRPQ